MSRYGVHAHRSDNYVYVCIIISIERVDRNCEVDLVSERRLQTRKKDRSVVCVREEDATREGKVIYLGCVRSFGGSSPSP